MGMLEGRVAICTGAARGVGAEVAKLMAKEGARIVVVDPGVGGGGEGGDQRPAEATADEITAGAAIAAPSRSAAPASSDLCISKPHDENTCYGYAALTAKLPGIADHIFPR